MKPGTIQSAPNISKAGKQLSAEEERNLFPKALELVPGLHRQDVETRLSGVGPRTPTARRREFRMYHGGKDCQHCDRGLPVSAFSKDSQTRDSLRGYCRECGRGKYLGRQIAQSTAQVQSSMRNSSLIDRDLVV